MPEPSKFVRVQRVARFTLKETIRVKIGGKKVDKTYAKKYPLKVIKTVSYTTKKATKTYKKGQSVSLQYAKRFPRYVSKTTIYRTKSITKVYRKGVSVSESFSKRYPSRVKTVEYMEILERQPIYDPILRKQTYGEWRVTSREKMNFYEKILNLKQITNRHIRTVFSRHHIFNNIWQNHKGNIRVTVNGHVEGRHVKEVVHIGYLKSLWETKHNGYEQFKDYVVNKVLQGLRRKHLRLSNPKESQERLVDLMGKRKNAFQRLETSPSWNKEKVVEEIKEIQKLIRQQKLSRQIEGGTIRIEKLVP